LYRALSREPSELIVRLPEYRVLRWIQIAGICLAAGVLLFLLYGAHEVGAWIFLGGAVMFAVRAVIEQRRPVKYDDE
jgi:drug/metabolite transporter (DMT)-like permease